MGRIALGGISYCPWRVRWVVEGDDGRSNGGTPTTHLPTLSSENKFLLYEITIYFLYFVNSLVRFWKEGKIGVGKPRICARMATWVHNFHYDTSSCCFIYSSYNILLSNLSYVCDILVMLLTYISGMMHIFVFINIRVKCNKYMCYLLIL